MPPGPIAHARWVPVYRDPVRSSKGHFVKTSGLRWLAAMLIIPVPWAERLMALPVLTALVPSERFYASVPRAPKALLDAARQMILHIHPWLPGRRIVVVADSAFAAIAFLAALQPLVCVVRRLRGDGPVASMPTCSRPRHPAARARAAGLPPIPIRWMIVRDPTGTFKPQGFLATDPDVTSEAMLGWFVSRWQVEVTFEEVRAHLGVETQRQWSDLAIARTTPAQLGLFSLVVLWMKDLAATERIAPDTTAWYRKTRLTFRDAIAAIQREIWQHQTFAISPGSPDSIEIPTHIWNRVETAVAYAR